MAFVAGPAGCRLTPCGNAARAARWRCSATGGKARPSAPSGGGGFGGFGKPTRFKYAGALRPGTLSPPRTVPDAIGRPSYARDGKPKEKWPAMPWLIEQKDADGVRRMREAGRVAREVLDAAGRAVAPGITTDEIDAIVHAETIKRGAYPSTLNYNRFPKSCCTSLNEVICHGIPDTTELKSGDIMNIDVTCFYNGFHGDCSETYTIGDVDQRGIELVSVTYEALSKAIAICEPGVHYYEIGGIIEDVATPHGFKSVSSFCGHGIGRAFHTAPNVLHYRNREPNGIMKPGHTFTIEPMLVEGSTRSILWPDKWTATTVDGKRSAQFEHTLLITEDGVEELTGRLDTSPPFTWK